MKQITVLSGSRLGGGGPNTIARALKTIEVEHPEKMAEVAENCRGSYLGTGFHLSGLYQAALGQV